MSDSLSVYWGLFLNACVPLEASLNYCSHKCAYCYANLNAPERTANSKQIMSLLSNFRERETFAAKLLQWGYPVCASNHVDFFAKSNFRMGLPILQTMAEMNIPVQIQTKGGDGFMEAIEILPPSVIYFTISTLDEEILKKIEPGAPSPKERLKQMAAAKEKGHRIVAGINPCVPEWLLDPKPLCNELKAVGSEGVWIQALHLSRRQIDNMSDREKVALGGETLIRGQRRKKDPEVLDLLRRTRECVNELGMACQSSGQKERSDFFRPYKETYKKTYPTLQDFVNYCYDNVAPGTPIYLQDFIGFFVPKLPAGVHSIGQHLGASQSRNFWKDNELKARMSYQELLEIVWTNSDITINPVHRDCFAWAATWDDVDGKPGWIQWLDRDRKPILLFNPKGYRDVFAEWEPE